MACQTQEYVWHRLPLAIGLQYYAQWWKDFNDRRRLFSFGKVAELLVLKLDSGESFTGPPVV